MNSKRTIKDTVIRADTPRAPNRFAIALATLLVGAVLAALVACAPEETDPEARVEPRDETVRIAYVP